MNDKGHMSEPDEIDAQLQLIAQMLREARAPLIYGLTQLTVEAQELAVELAMCLRGAIDTRRGARIPPRGTSLQLHGEARTTLGELRQNADLVVFVACEPTPELLASFVVNGSSALRVKQRQHLKIAAVDRAILEAQVRELSCWSMDEVLALRKKLKAKPTSDSSHEQLLAAWQTAKYPVLVYNPGSLVKSGGKKGATYLIEQIERTVLARAKFGRAAAWPLGDSGCALSNAAGAEYVLTARTGYPAAVQCFSGSAEFLPGLTNAETLLADGVIDAALFLGEGPSAEWSDEATQHLQNIPSAIIASKEVLNGQTCNHQIACNALNEEQGTILREDGIPIPLNASDAPKASTENFLRRLLELVREPATVAAGAAR